MEMTEPIAAEQKVPDRSSDDIPPNQTPACQHSWFAAPCQSDCFENTSKMDVVVISEAVCSFLRQNVQTVRFETNSLGSLHCTQLQ